MEGKFGSTAVHGKILLVSNISKNLWILKAASCHTAERTDYARALFWATQEGLQIIWNSQDPIMHMESFTEGKTRKIGLFRAFLCTAR